MFLKIPFFGLLPKRSPMDGLIEHYDKIDECVAIIDESLECYVSGGVCREFNELTRTIDDVEAHADKIKRNLRNHLPRGLFMAVEKTLFLNYTRTQDNILDSAQDALHWLAMRPVGIPAEFQHDIIDLLSEVRDATEALGPALKATIDLIHGDSMDREGTKDLYRDLRRRRELIRRQVNLVTARIYNSEMDFKDIYQLIHFVDRLGSMGHNCEGCVDILRNMIAR